VSNERFANRGNRPIALVVFHRRSCCIPLETMDVDIDGLYAGIVGSSQQYASQYHLKIILQYVVFGSLLMG